MVTSDGSDEERGSAPSNSWQPPRNISGKPLLQPEPVRASWREPVIMMAMTPTGVAATAQV